jgi:aryl-alcohol dehydrogenase-like predicted oxidoreductase
MQYRKFGNTGLVVSEIGFGAWAIGGGAMIGNTAIGWGAADDATSVEAIEAALDAGITFFDTADIYGLGHSEDLLGRTIHKEANVVIATKVGNVSRNQEFTTDYSKEYILAACERSLKRLKKDTIDYYQLHTAKLEHLKNGECIEAMQTLQQEGKIRYWGLSLNTFEPATEARFCMENQWGHGFQLVLNLINQKAVDLLKESAAEGYGIIARMPLQFGLLTGKFTEASTFEENDHRQKRLTSEVIGKADEALQPVWELCHKYKCTKTAMALSFVLSYAGVSTVIPGIRSSGQVIENTTGLVKLDESDQELIESLGKTSLADLLSFIQKQG